MEVLVYAAVAVALLLMLGLPAAMLVGLLGFLRSRRDGRGAPLHDAPSFQAALRRLRRAAAWLGYAVEVGSSAAHEGTLAGSAPSGHAGGSVARVLRTRTGRERRALERRSRERRSEECRALERTVQERAAQDRRAAKRRRGERRSGDRRGQRALAFAAPRPPGQ